MADKMYLIEKAILTSLADRIRNKTSKSDKITFPDEFFDEITNIETTPPTALPVLDPNYPEDVIVMESVSGSATFNISIITPGQPAEYTYQWYVNGEAVSGATSLSYTKSGLTSAATYNVYCEITNKAGTVTSRVATLTITSSKPVYTYSGSATLVQDGTYNWRIKLLTSGTLEFTSLGSMVNGIDVFLVGGGGGGSAATATDNTTAAGGGGYTKTINAVSIAKNQQYSIVVGAGGAMYGNGGASSAFGQTVSGGYGCDDAANENGGKGGSGGAGCGGNGGTDGGNGGGSRGGKGQGTTTREFGESSGALYAGGGGDYRYKGGDGGGGDSGKPGTTNTGGGGGWRGEGGSGIIIIRNVR